MQEPKIWFKPSSATLILQAGGHTLWGHGGMALKHFRKGAWCLHNPNSQLCPQTWAGDTHMG